MNRWTRPLLACLTLVILTLLLSGCDDGVVRGTVVYKGQHVFEAGQVVQGGLVVISGRAVVEQGSTVEGSAWVLGGTTTVAGTVAGDVTGLAGKLTILDTADIAGNVILGGSFTDIAPGAHIQGTVRESLSTVSVPKRAFSVRLFAALQLVIVQALVALLLSFWWSSALIRVGSTAVAYPAVSVATGVLSGVTGLVILVFVGFTVILLPLVMLLGLGAWLAVAFGWAGLGAWFGGRLPLKRVPQPVRVALGSLVVAAVVQLATLIPVVGALLGFGVTFWGLGAVILTRFGYQTFQPATIPEIRPEGAE